MCARGGERRRKGEREWTDWRFLKNASLLEKERIGRARSAEGQRRCSGWTNETDELRRVKKKVLNEFDQAHFFLHFFHIRPFWDESSVGPLGMMPVSLNK